ncbi:hypothetical protein CapIbe_014375 [Capra ibex]
MRIFKTQRHPESSWRNRKSHHQLKARMMLMTEHSLKRLQENSGSGKPKNSVQATKLYQKNQATKEKLSWLALPEQPEWSWSLVCWVTSGLCFCELILALPLSTADILRLITKHSES